MGLYLGIIIGGISVLTIGLVISLYVTYRTQKAEEEIKKMEDRFFQFVDKLDELKERE